MEYQKAYDLWHKEIGPDKAVANSPWHLLVVAHLSLLADVAGKRVLEIGCGRGGFLCWLAVHVPRPCVSMVGIDYSPNAIASACALAKAPRCLPITWEVGDIQAIGHSSNTFDTVISCETIEHVPHPDRAMRELARVLKPGGKLFLTTPNYLGLMGLYRLYLRLRGRRFTEVGQPINHFTSLPRTLAWVKRSGLHILIADGVGHYLPVPGRPPIRIGRLDRFRAITRWFALHSIVIAIKPP